MRLEVYIRKITVFAFLALTSISVSAQDLLARQAPVDRRMRTLDTIAVNQLISKEERENPAAQLYDDSWNTTLAHPQEGNMPSHMVINLRHFCMPTPSRVVTSNFGARWGRMHKGLDIKVYIGDTIRAAWSGKVRVVKYDGGGYGKYIVIRHPNGLETIYGHLSKQLVDVNEEVHAGDPIGLGGNTGRSTGSHLHFETRLCGVALNPALFFDFRNQDVTGDTYTYDIDTYKEESAQATRLRGKVGNGGYTREMVQGNNSESSHMNQSAVRSYEGIRYHKIHSGETVASIAEKRGVTVEQICRLNHINKTTKLKPGNILRYS